MKKCMFDGVQHLLLMYQIEVKQGVTLSPMFFNHYMDQTEHAFDCVGVWGDIGGHLITHLCYTDDLEFNKFVFCWNAIFIGHL